MTLTYPVPGWPITTAFNGYPGHRGCDMACPPWTPILAAHGGVVTYAAWEFSGGGFMVNLYEEGTRPFGTSYQHMIQHPSVNVGEWVNAGQVIGYAGSTGYSTGDHLHFEYWDGGRVWGINGTPINPAPLLQGGNMSEQDSQRLSAVYSGLYGPRNVKNEGGALNSWYDASGKVNTTHYGLIDIEIHTQSLVAQLSTKLDTALSQLNTVLTQLELLTEEVSDLRYKVDNIPDHDGVGGIDQEAIEDAAGRGARDGLSTLVMKLEISEQ